MYGSIAVTGGRQFAFLSIMSEIFESALYHVVWQLDWEKHRDHAEIQDKPWFKKTKGTILIFHSLHICILLGVIAIKLVSILAK